ncbi:MAG: MerR family DNA-binding transcriptional regulator [Moorea sp. SIO4A3]|nr:MerR family DNA-binding transcriptional regulator [Moorena sp. SIO4A3]
MEVSEATLEGLEANGEIKMIKTQNGIRRYDLDSLSGGLRRMINPERFPENKKTKKWASPKEAAIALGVTERTLKNWEAAGKIKSVKNKKGRRFYDLSSLVYQAK